MDSFDFSKNIDGRLSVLRSNQMSQEITLATYDHYYKKTVFITAIKQLTTCCIGSPTTRLDSTTVNCIYETQDPKG